MKTYTATTDRGFYTVQYTVKAWLKEDAEQRIFEMSGEHLTVKEVK